MADPSILLLYPPLQFSREAVAKPDGSLSLPYLAGALRDAGFQVAILDCSVGQDGDPLEETFFRQHDQANGQVRHGLSESAILDLVEPHDIIGITSIFTPQTTPTLELIRIIKSAFPEVAVVAGGVNARALRERFLDAGADMVCLSEGERTIVAVAEEWAREIDPSAKDRGWHGVPGIAYRRHGKTVVTKPAQIDDDLDTLPMPAWDLLPNEQYWAIGRPHGGRLAPGTTYAGMMTTRGCPFSCSYCFESKGHDAASESGEYARYRMKSRERVLREADTLKALGVGYVYIEDDSLLAKKSRAMAIFRDLASRGLRLADVNGVNIAHLFRNVGGARLEPDHELLGLMAACGFEELSLPFESGSQRILNTYASGKWNLERLDTMALIRAAMDAGLHVSGNYMLGYPDEQMDEIMATLRMARRHVDAGLEEVNVFLVVPFPGSELFDLARREGYLPDDWSPDHMRWFAPTMVNTTVPPNELQRIRDVAWLLLNRPAFVEDREQAIVKGAR